MSGCALRRWGPGTQCIKTDTPASKEMADKLAIMRAEREKQDTMWLQPNHESPISHPPADALKKAAPHKDSGQTHTTYRLSDRT